MPQFVIQDFCLKTLKKSQVENNPDDIIMVTLYTTFWQAETSAPNPMCEITFWSEIPKYNIVLLEWLSRYDFYSTSLTLKPVQEDGENTAIQIRAEHRRTLSDTYVRLTRLPHVWHFSSITVITDSPLGLGVAQSNKKKIQHSNSTEVIDRKDKELLLLLVWLEARCNLAVRSFYNTLLTGLFGRLGHISSTMILNY